MDSKELLNNRASLAYAAALYKIGDLLLDAKDCDTWRQDGGVSGEFAEHLAAVAAYRRETAAHLANTVLLCFRAEGNPAPDIT
jgi:hypothetical protein